MQKDDLIYSESGKELEWERESKLTKPYAHAQTGYMQNILHISYKRHWRPAYLGSVPIYNAYKSEYT